MDQQVIANFKKFYTKALFQKCFQTTSETQLTLIQFWTERFNILSCLQLIEKAWKDVTLRALMSAWKKLLSKVVQEKDFEGFDPEPAPENDPVVEEIVNMAVSMGLEADSDDVEELVEEYNEELSTDELLAEQQRMAEQEISEDEGNEEVTEEIPSSVMKEMLAKWAELQTFAENHHPDKERTNRNIDLFNDGTMNFFRQLLKRRQRQTTMDMFAKRLKPNEPEAGGSALQTVPSRPR
ncbi:uncharacterized protein LOC120523134 [Polypterus senegalus]|uniref:uncharacterized protein LOC120523134 n=1 Tax=Polypterus senegalus TaxID=55291 RepID=UPI00196447C9|nr:uncharacterized protein LOC120523134 [Polypterus senegalus]